MTDLSARPKSLCALSTISSFAFAAVKNHFGISKTSTNRSCAPVFDLPRVIEKMPRHAAGDVTRRPALLAGLRSSRGRLNCVDDHVTPCMQPHRVGSTGRLHSIPD